MTRIPFLISHTRTSELSLKLVLVTQLQLLNSRLNNSKANIMLMRSQTSKIRYVPKSVRRYMHCTTSCNQIS